MNSVAFEIRIATSGCPADSEIENLLRRVYVDAGFADDAFARSKFVADAVRARGTLLAAMLCDSGQLIGTIVLVPHDSPARRFAVLDEAELHLFGVLPEYRNQGVGRQLIEAVMERACQTGYRRLLLWTQPSMKAAHRLYAETGFVHHPERDFHMDGRDFTVMQAELSGPSEGS